MPPEPVVGYRLLARYVCVSGPHKGRSGEVAVFAPENTLGVTLRLDGSVQQITVEPANIRQIGTLLFDTTTNAICVLCGYVDDTHVLVHTAGRVVAKHLTEVRASIGSIVWHHATRKMGVVMASTLSLAYKLKQSNGLCTTVGLDEIRFY